MKTNWDGLSEEAKKLFRDYVIICDEKTCKHVCVNSVFIGSRLERCKTTCRILFPGLNSFANRIMCPCMVYGSEAFQTLKKIVAEENRK